MPCGPRSGLWDWLALQAAALQSGPSHSLAACFLGPDVPRAGLQVTACTAGRVCNPLFPTESYTPVSSSPAPRQSELCLL